MLCLLLAAGALPARAALTESDFFDDLPVVLSASRLSQPVNEAPAAIIVIDQDMIRASGFRDIPDLFRLVPGFTAAYIRDNTWGVGYHGLADAFSRRMQVLLNLILSYAWIDIDAEKKGYLALCTEEQFLRAGSSQAGRGLGGQCRGLQGGRHVLAGRSTSQRRLPGSMRVWPGVGSCRGIRWSWPWLDRTWAASTTRSSAILICSTAGLT
ncbi:MAG: hypothetical protein LT080_00220 [Thiobacillus sp.]|nr:hypothetical protein [Thiobacillus sp.]